MRIVTYCSMTVGGPNEAPAGQGYIARLRLTVPAPKGKTVEEWHPVLFTGESYAAVQAQAQAWWDAEVAKVEAKRANGLRLAKSRQSKAAQQPVPA